jgi:selT/selW/selH-like putative selenoprotein
LQAAIKKEFGITASLKSGHGGVFDVTLDGRRIYSKDETHRFPTDAEVFAKIRAHQKA